VYAKNVLKDIKATSQRGAYWKTQQDIRVEKLDIGEDFTVPKKLAALLANAKDDPLRKALMTAISWLLYPKTTLFFCEAIIVTPIKS
jgi:hypothetical protein